ncbi:MAG: glycosyltransferase family 39 protein [Candidatus Spechtbacteria bacterium]|nr:glycosyltransferase family 39 protein [Candidatus Spechtbacteria bacterium]
MKKFVIGHWVGLALLTIILIGAFLRFFNLSTLPPGIYPDEARNGIDALHAMATGQYSVFYPANNGREGLYIDLLTIVFRIFGVSIFSLKLISAAIGMLTIWTVYLLAKELQRFIKSEKPMWYQEAISLVASLFIATSFWHINFSRISFRAIFVPFLLSLATYYTLRMLRRGSLFDTIVAGALWALGMYTYIAFRVAPIIPAFLIGSTLLVSLAQNRDNKNIKRWIKMIAAFALSGIIVFLPLAIYFITNSGSFASRSAGISVFSEPQPILAFLKSLGAHLQMFFYQGDGNWRHNISGQAQLLFPIALLFLLGTYVVIHDAFHGLRTRQWEKAIGMLAIGMWFDALLLPAILTIEGIPHALRSIGVIPVTYLIAAIGFAHFLGYLLRQNISWIRSGGFALAIALLVALPLTAYNQYFNVWGNNPNVPGAFSQYYTQIGYFLNALPDDTPKVVFVNSDGVLVPIEKYLAAPTNKDNTIPMSSQTTLFIQNTKSVHPQNTIYATEKELENFIPQKGSIVIPLEPNDKAKTFLKEKFRGTGQQPGGIWFYQMP